MPGVVWRGGGQEQLAGGQDGPQGSGAGVIKGSGLNGTSEGLRGAQGAGESALQVVERFLWHQVVDFFALAGHMERRAHIGSGGERLRVASPGSLDRCLDGADVTICGLAGIGERGIVGDSNSRQSKHTLSRKGQLGPQRHATRHYCRPQLLSGLTRRGLGPWGRKREFTERINVAGMPVS